jgi:hypothetical protein
MEIRIQVIIDNDERTRRDIAHWDRPSLTSETLGLQLDEARALLQASQEAMVSAQVEAYLAKQADCPHCGRYTASRVDMKSSCAASSAHFVWAVRASVIAHVREAARPLQIKALARWPRLFPTEPCRNDFIWRASGPPSYPTA